MDKAFIIFFLNYCLDHCFKSKAGMAREIGVGVGIIMYAFDRYKVIPARLKGRMGI